MTRYLVVLHFSNTSTRPYIWSSVSNRFETYGKLQHIAVLVLYLIICSRLFFLLRRLKVSGGSRVLGGGWGPKKKNILDRNTGRNHKVSFVHDLTHTIFQQVFSKENPPPLDPPLKVNNKCNRCIGV